MYVNSRTPVLFLKKEAGVCTLETYSSVPIAKAGAQKYIQSPDFEILLFAYSLDGGDVQIIDLAQGELLPQWLASALSDPQYIKHAYNASFEWGCLSKFMGTLPIDQWRCTMFHGLYCGYTAGLDATGKALGLPADKQKLSTGKALIRYFCVPCAPTKTNGGRTRNYPRHDPAKWALLKEYCIGDVTTEMEILHRLENFPVPPELEKQWQTDVLINARGVAVDMDMVRGALWIGETTRDQLTEEAVTLSGLDNPNSVKQLMQWLEEELDEELTDLRKDTVSRLLNGNLTNDTARRMLEIRQELGKTSTKKYNAIEAAVCADGRVPSRLSCAENISCSIFSNCSSHFSLTFCIVAAPPTQFFVFRAQPPPLPSPAFQNSTRTNAFHVCLFVPIQFHAPA